MTIRREERDGESHLIIDISYRTESGKLERYRRDAQVQTRKGAQAEHRRLEDQLARAGTLKPQAPDPEDATPPPILFKDAVRIFRATHLKSGLKPSTRLGYENQLNRLLLPRFGDLPLEAVNRVALAELDAELAEEGLTSSTRAKPHIVVRSVLRNAMNAGMIEAMPKLARIPKSGRKVLNPMRRPALDAILAAALPSARLAFELAAFAGLRAGEVRGLRWHDVDLVAGTISVRCSISSGFETTPKSHHQRRIPIGRGLRETLVLAQLSKPKPTAHVAVTREGNLWGENGLNQVFKRAAERAKLDTGWSFHDLRHFFVTELFRNGANAVAVQQLAGHADLTTTQRYADFDANDLRSAIERIDGNSAETGHPRPANDC